MGKNGYWITLDDKYKSLDEWLSEHDVKVRTDAIDYAIHQIDNSKVNCHEDYICGINYSIGVLEGIAEQLKEQKNDYTGIL